MAAVATDSTLYSAYLNILLKFKAVLITIGGVNNKTRIFSISICEGFLIHGNVPDNIGNPGTSDSIP